MLAYRADDRYALAVFNKHIRNVQSEFSREFC